VTEIENFRKLTHLNQFSRQKHTHARVSVILPQLPDIIAHLVHRGTSHRLKKLFLSSQSMNITL
jgi:hypothetical protein